MKYSALILALLISCLSGRMVQAQEPEKPNATKAVEEAKEAWGRILPNESGTPIQDNQQTWAYVAGIGGFVLVFVLALVGIRLLAYLMMFASFAAGAAIVFMAIHQHAAATWQQLAVIVLGVAIVAASVAATARLYVIRDKP